MSEFVSAPPPSSGVPWGSYVGALFVIEPLSFEPQVSTANGIKDAVRANVHVLKGAAESEDYEDALIFGVSLVSQTKASIGLKIVGRLSQGTAKAGQNAPWILDAATPDDLAKASAWLAKRSAPTLTGASPPFATSSQVPF